MSSGTGKENKQTLQIRTTLLMTSKAMATTGKMDDI